MSNYNPTKPYVYQPEPVYKADGTLNEFPYGLAGPGAEAHCGERFTKEGALKALAKLEESTMHEPSVYDLHLYGNCGGAPSCPYCVPEPRTDFQATSNEAEPEGPQNRAERRAKLSAMNTAIAAAMVSVERVWTEIPKLQFHTRPQMHYPRSQTKVHVCKSDRLAKRKAAKAARKKQRSK